MPRAPEPRWKPDHRLWYAAIGPPDKRGRATEIYAPSSIGELDKEQAWEWFRSEKRKREAEVEATTSDTALVSYVFEHYLARCEQRVADGKLPIEEYRNKSRHLGIGSLILGMSAARTLTPYDLTAFGESLLDSYAPMYVRNVCATIRASLNWATKEKLIESNPVKG
ncbi:hypothetical protein [Singulisphaera sp. PoT]|uniref:hypothetical protein n=1 Tax=Singulisphaera sp. PoT TaxID=3411797 RepID=UPI003BF599A3